MAWKKASVKISQTRFARSKKSKKFKQKLYKLSKAKLIQMMILIKDFFIIISWCTIIVYHNLLVFSLGFYNLCKLWSYGMQKWNILNDGSFLHLFIISDFQKRFHGCKMHSKSINHTLHVCKTGNFILRVSGEYGFRSDKDLI